MPQKVSALNTLFTKHRLLNELNRESSIRRSSSTILWPTEFNFWKQNNLIFSNASSSRPSPEEEDKTKEFRACTDSGASKLEHCHNIAVEGLAWYYLWVTSCDFLCEAFAQLMYSLRFNNRNKQMQSFHCKPYTLWIILRQTCRISYEAKDLYLYMIKFGRSDSSKCNILIDGTSWALVEIVCLDIWIWQVW